MALRGRGWLDGQGRLPRTLHDERGQATVELVAIVILPIMLALHFWRAAQQGRPVQLAHDNASHSVERGGGWMACRTSRCTEQSGQPGSRAEAALHCRSSFCVPSCCSRRSCSTRGAPWRLRRRGRPAAATAPPGPASACTSYGAQETAAVPEVSILHAGGAHDWQVESRGERARWTTIGHGRPLPLMGVVAGAFGQAEGGNVVLEAHVAEQVRPSWLEGARAGSRCGWLDAAAARPLDLWASFSTTGATPR